jgi:hypothetical protein
LVVDRHDAPDAAEVHSFQIEAHGFALDFFRLAERLRVWRVEAGTLSALVGLAARVGVSRFGLLF